MNRKKYKLVDIYENIEKLGDFDTKKEVAHACQQREIDTDSECSFVLYVLNSNGIYQQIQNWSYSKNSIKIYPTPKPL